MPNDDLTIHVQTPPDKALRMEMTRRENFYLLTGISLVDLQPAPLPPPDPEPEPPPDPGDGPERLYCLTRTDRTLVPRALGSIDGQGPISYLDRGDRAAYDYREFMRTVRYDEGGSGWQVRNPGGRTLYMCDGIAHGDATFKDACASGGAWYCPDTGPKTEWSSCYQSAKGPTGIVFFKDCSARNVLLEAVRGRGGWDGFQNGKGTFGKCDATLRRWILDEFMDDGVENDNYWPLGVDRCLFKSFATFSARGTTSADGSKELVSARNSFFELLPRTFKGKADQTGTFFKLGGKSPMYELFDSTFVARGRSIEAGGEVLGQLKEFGKLSKAERCVFCWLGEGRNPHWMPKGFTALEGDEAAKHADAVEAEIWRRFNGRRLPGDPAIAA